MRRTLATLASLTWVLALACSEQPVEREITDIEECIQDHSVADGYGHDVDDETYDCPQPIDDDPVECDPPSPESVAEEADEDGHPFDPAAVISRDAALCISETEGYDQTQDDLLAGLTYNYGHQRPIWFVMRVLEYRESGAIGSGDEFHIDALTGEVLGEYLWEIVE